MKIEYTRSAAQDLGNLLEYYRDQGVFEKGHQLALEIMKKADRLAEFPDSGRIVPELGINILREVIFPPFRIIYRRELNKIWIVRIWRSEQLLKLD